MEGRLRPSGWVGVIWWVVKRASREAQPKKTLQPARRAARQPKPKKPKMRQTGPREPQANFNRAPRCLKRAFRDAQDGRREHSPGMEGSGEGRGGSGTR
eukprot:4316532-Pyramimonas_sp.AAC.1